MPCGASTWTRRPPIWCASSRPTRPPRKSSAVPIVYLTRCLTQSGDKIMRISSTQMNQQGISAILEQQAQLSKTQLQLSTGRRVVTPADDPAASAQALGLTQAVTGTQQYQTNIDVAQWRLSLEEGV